MNSPAKAMGIIPEPAKAMVQCHQGVGGSPGVPAKTSLTGLTAPRHVTHKPRLGAQAPGPIPSAHRPIAIIDQPTGPITAQN
ncbi:hypothetical protein DY000_02006531 [Brassica cretica]|uniref:Uncharacterized protein n=1 Tax=Brassica cretica TaxID=69181 RepID=A0ABQ7BV62_BRACR|nr:hypothetical protein DY000_02006531 [Brassica cretica]